MLTSIFAITTEPLRAEFLRRDVAGELQYFGQPARAGTAFPVCYTWFMERPGYRSGDKRSEDEINAYREASAIFQRYNGLSETLRAWCGPSLNPVTPLTFEAVVRIVAADKAAREATKSYLNGRWAHKDKFADIVRERLAWALVDELGKAR